MFIDDDNQDKELFSIIDNGSDSINGCNNSLHNENDLIINLLHLDLQVNKYRLRVKQGNASRSRKDNTITQNMISKKLSSRIINKIDYINKKTSRTTNNDTK